MAFCMFENMHIKEITTENVYHENVLFLFSSRQRIENLNVTNK